MAIFKSVKFYIILVSSLLVVGAGITIPIVVVNNNKEETYKVDFVVDGEIYHTVEVEEGQKITKPADPTKDNFLFDGWFLDGEKWLFNAGTVNSDMTLIANFTNLLAEKVVPIFQGMSAKDMSVLAEIQKLGNSIEDDVISNYEVIETTGVEIFRTKGQEYLINIHIYNPSSFEILSLTLDGVKYQSYQFQEGSDSSEIYIKMVAPDKSGIIDVTVDAIKYIDGVEIKDVRMDGERTINVGVEYEDVPTAVQTNREVDSTNYITATPTDAYVRTRIAEDIMRFYDLIKK